MPHPKKTNKFQRVLLSWPFIIVLLILVVLVAVAAWNMFQTQRGTQTTVARLEADREDLLARKTSVSDAALDVSTDRGVQQEIREKFSVAKEGERVIVLVDDEDNNSTSSTESQGWVKSIFSKIWPF